MVDSRKATDLALVRLFVSQVAKIENVAGLRAAFHPLSGSVLLVGVARDIDPYKAP